MIAILQSDSKSRWNEVTKNPLDLPLEIYLFQKTVSLLKIS